ncbi:FKBP-type peptidyl-prolyl cis-trans isomerase [Maribacter confluentis]|uniref:peptidylprolyl isomerase n=1 Tax=Maribacter confluentis TaxID=1656093 RepID=A0ABT8RTD2_9FLAO|nr:FKBP-type peptidyl-prolyl cis-trans isomerase [Maribacter confluentis]MDO1514158.1 FKBP-type peptidyl-prolyl cis-trans isomerase [Maribacter confluentis]
MNLKYAYLLIAGFFVISSCKKDDDPIGEIVPPRLLSEVAVEDDAEIIEFLKTHFYNEEEFETPPDGFDYKIKFDTIAGDNEGKESIFDSKNLITETFTVASSDFGRDDDEVMTVKLYTLVVRQGIKEGKPTIGDNVIIRYEGSLLDGTLFDASTNQPTVFNLSGVVRGFGNGMKNFQTGQGPIEVGDGTVTYDGYGIGAIFIPSALGYFDDLQNRLSVAPKYSPLIFKIDAFAYEPDFDFDGDGIPSIQEDLNGNGNLNDDNTDDDLEGLTVYLPNYNDSDDDNDGIPTIDEIKINGVIVKDDKGIVQFPDTDKDGIPDHLDNDL